MTLSPSHWHVRFSQQARWTQDLRNFLYTRAGLFKAERVLDVGCGTGALLPELISGHQTSVIGLDINRSSLNYAQSTNSSAALIRGDAHNLPFADGSYDLTLCHFLLLWVSNPIRVLEEMVRLTRPGGAVLAMAEPDYGGRIDYPPELERLGDLQELSLRQQGADTRLGRRLAAMFNHVGLKSIEFGVLGGQWRISPANIDWQTEWDVLISDLESISPKEIGLPTQEELEDLAIIDRHASQRGERILFVPTFYAWGKV